LRQAIFPYIVVDQNCLRDAEVLDRLVIKAKALNQVIVLPDTAFIEMTKNAQWELTIQQSLKVLAKYPAHVAASYSPGQLLRMERDSGQPHCDIVWHEATPFIKRLLHEVAEGKNDYLKELEPLIFDAQETFKKEKLNHEENKIYVAAAVEFWELVLSEEMIKKLRRKDRELLTHLLASPGITEFCRIGLTRLGWAKDSVQYLARNPSVSSHNFLCIAALGLRCVADGGLEGKSDQRITNDVADLDYMLMATFCKELLTRDVRLKELYRCVCAAVEQRERRNG
jgi:hypothetical protein